MGSPWSIGMTRRSSHSTPHLIVLRWGSAAATSWRATSHFRWILLHWKMLVRMLCRHVFVSQRWIVSWQFGQSGVFYRLWEHRSSMQCGLKIPSLHIIEIHKFLLHILRLLWKMKTLRTCSMKYGLNHSLHTIEVHSLHFSFTNCDY